GGIFLLTSWKLWAASDSWCNLLESSVRAAASRTFCTAGRRRPMRMAMMAITTSSSISVKPRFRGGPRLVMSESCDANDADNRPREQRYRKQQARRSSFQDDVVGLLSFSDDVGEGRFIQLSVFLVDLFQRLFLGFR